ncbi:MAG: AEC family transporter [Desulfovibrio sp.]|nr:AEC family transporter [Desulfovibrio sp.]
MVFFHALEGVLVLVILGATGYGLAALHWVGKESRSTLPRIITNVALPPYLMYAIMNNFQRDRLWEMLQGILPPLLSVSLAFLLALGLAKIFRVQRKRCGLFCASIANSNTIFIGIPVNIALFGEGAMPHVLLYYIASTIFFWTIGQYAILSDAEKMAGVQRMQLSKIFSPPLLGFLLGLALTALGCELPHVLKMVAQNLGNLTTPLAMIFIGISLYDMGVTKLTLDKDIFLLIAGRMLMAPLLMFELCRLFHLPTDMSNVFVMQASLPVMMQAAILSAYYHADGPFGSRGVAYTTLLSIVTIPVLMTLLH